MLIRKLTQIPKISAKKINKCISLVFRVVHTNLLVERNITRYSSNEMIG